MQNNKLKLAKIFRPAINLNLPGLRKAATRQVDGRSENGGFTLIELMVALGVFMVVMTITLSAFLNIIDIQKKTEAFRKVNDNLNFAMEAMMREIREGTKYCPSGCASGSFSFTNKDGDAIKGDVIKYDWDETGKYIKRTKGTDALE